MCSAYFYVSVLYFLSISNHGFVVSSSTELAQKIPIHIGGFFSFGGVWESGGILPAVEMALDHINARSDILPDYDLRMVWNDTQCEASLGTRVLFHQLLNEPQKLVLIGDGCSPSSQAIARTAYHWNLNVISYAASSPTLSNRVDYPNFFRTIMPDTMFNPARIRMMKAFNWTKVATIHGKHEIFSLATDHLIDVLNKSNMTILTSETFASDDSSNQIQNLKNIDAKIITVNMYPTKARRVLCEAYRNEMVGAGYVWMLLGWYGDKWWEERDELVKCSLEEMRRAARSSFYISTESLQLSTSSDLTIANITAAQYTELLMEYMKDPRWANYDWHNDNPFGYDATWAIALMLDKAVHVVNSTLGRRLEDFTYDDKDMGEIFFELLNKTRFTGVSGPVSFRNGDRVGIIQIRQLQAGGCLNSTWELHDEECFLFVNQTLPYSQAVQHCKDLGAEVAAIINETEYRFIVDTLQKSQEYSGQTQWFVGMMKTNQTYLWQDSRFVDMNWTPPRSQLNTNNEHRCVYTTLILEDGWAAVSCNNALPFICRMEEEFLEKPVAMFTDTGEDGGQFEMTGQFVWPGGKVPLDHTPQIEAEVVRVHIGITKTLYVVMCVLACCGIFLALFFLAFNLRYRQQRFVKMSSPNLNNLIILGSIFVFVAIVVGGLDSNLVSVETVARSCQIQAYFLSLGFVLAFGAVFTKTWRVHKIAAFSKPRRRIITDNQLFLIVFVMLLVDLFILVLWHAIDPMTVTTQDHYVRDDPDVSNRQLQPYYDFCSCNHQIYWWVSLFSYKAVMLIFGAFLAWETRKVTIPALNDSKLIGMIVYNVIVLCIICIAAKFIISQEDPVSLYIFTSCVVLFCTTMSLLIVFGPKIISVYKFPEGPPLPSITNNSGTPDCSIDNVLHVEGLLEENKKIKQKLAEVEAENKRLKRSKQASIKPKTTPANFKGGCDLRFAGAICGCCSDAPEEAYRETCRPKQNWVNNETVETSGV